MAKHMLIKITFSEGREVANFTKEMFLSSMNSSDMSLKVTKDSEAFPTFLAFVRLFRGVI